MKQDMDDAIEHNNGQYMFASTQELHLHAAPPAVSDLNCPVDDLTEICQNNELYNFNENMEDLLLHIDAMEEEQRNDIVHPVMAAVPETKTPTRKSTRRGAGKRKVHFGDANNDRWQQFPNAQAAPIHAADPSQQQLPPQPPVPTRRRPTLRSTVRRKDKTPEDEEEEKEEALDPSRMPKSFPIGQTEDPTPGTTNLHEPPQETAMPPTQELREKVVIDIPDDDDQPECSTLHKISKLERLLETVSQELSDLKTGVFSNARQAEEAKATPILVLKIRAEDVSDTSFAQHNLA